MLPKVIEARHAGEHRIWLKFADGLAGELDLAGELWGPVFEPLKDVAKFAMLHVDVDTDTIAWSNGADFSPSWLRQQLEKALATTAAAE